MNHLAFKVASLVYLADAQINTPDGEFQTGLPKVGASGGAGFNDVQKILAIVFGAIGAAALIFIIIGALKFVTSGGDPQETAKAKNTIIYAAVGLAIALSAELIVTFVLNRI